MRNKIHLVISVIIIGLAIYFKLFSTSGAMIDTSIEIKNNLTDSNSYSYIQFNYPDEDVEYTHYRYENDTITRYDNGELYKTMKSGETDYETAYELIYNTATSADMSEIPIDDISIVDDVTLNVEGFDTSGEWYRIEVKGGCQNFRCMRNGSTSNDIYVYYVKVDGKGFIDGDSYALLID